MTADAKTSISTTPAVRFANGYLVASGAAKVTASYAGSNGTKVAEISFVIPFLARGDLNSDEQVDLNDLNILLAYRNASANGPNDARDLNKDGKIDALDARILTTLCTYPRCATAP